MNKSALQNRWKSAEGQALASRVLLFLRGNYGELPREIGSHEGLHDLRGLVLPLPTMVGSVWAGEYTAGVLDNLLEFRGVQWQDLDLSHAQLGSARFFSSAISDCRLDGANCGDWRLWDSAVKDTSFVKAHLRDSAVGTWHEERRNTWRNVNFDAADLRGVLARGCLIEHCTFSKARLRGTDFQQVSMRHCRFTGLLQDIRFDGRPLPDQAVPGAFVDVDFGEATFKYVEFRGCHFEDVTLPAGVTRIPNFPGAARRALALL